MNLLSIVNQAYDSAQKRKEVQLYLRQMSSITQYVLLTGSDLGNRESNLSLALELISARVGKVLKTSSIIESEPWGFESDTRFLNQAILIETSLGPETLLDEILEIEREIGRIRTQEHWTSRIIDIDILCSASTIFNSERLSIPHKWLHERKFALEPLNQLVDWVHPSLRISYAQLELNLSTSSKVLSLTD